MIQRHSIGLLLAAVALCLPAASRAGVVTLGFDPITREIRQNQQFGVNVRVQGLSAFAAPSLGVFDLNILYNPLTLVLDSVVFGDQQLGDQMNFGAGSLYFSTPLPASINLVGISFEEAFTLDQQQLADFTLATIFFTSVGVGTAELGLEVNSLGDALGNPIAGLADLELNPGRYELIGVPEPSTIVLAGCGLVAFVWYRRTRRLPSLSA